MQRQLTRFKSFRSKIHSRQFASSTQERERERKREEKVRARGEKWLKTNEAKNHGGEISISETRGIETRRLN